MAGLGCLAQICSRLAASPELDQRVRTNGQSAGRGNLGPPGHSDPIRAELNQAPGNYTHPPPTQGYAHLEPAPRTEKIANSMCDLSNNATETTDSGFYKNCRKRNDTDTLLNLNAAQTLFIVRHCHSAFVARFKSGT